MCTCKSQLCLYNSHFCDNHGFPFRIHRCLSKETKKTRNEYKLSLIMTFISKFYLYKCSHCLGSQACTCSCKSQECWYSSHLCDNHGFHPCSREEPPIMAYRGSFARIAKGVPFPDFRCMKGFRISIVEVYERVGNSVSFWSVKGPKRANRRILWLWKSRENLLASFVIYSQFKDSTSTAAKSNAKF